jgi:hypothetical protein
VARSADSVSSPRVLPAGQDPSVHDTFDEQAERRLAAARLEGVQVRGDAVRIPARYPYELTLVAGVPARPGQLPMYDARGGIPIPSQ